MSELTFGPIEMGALAKHGEFSRCLPYPPFSISLTKHSEFADALNAAMGQVGPRLQQNNDREVAFAGIFNDLEHEHSDAIEEAKLYMKRYGNDIYSAQAAALELEGLTEEDDDVPSI